MKPKATPASEKQLLERLAVLEAEESRRKLLATVKAKQSDLYPTAWQRLVGFAQKWQKRLDRFQQATAKGEVRKTAPEKK